MLLAQVGPGDFSTALMTMLSVAGLGVVGGYTFVYFSHVFFAISDATSVGQDDIIWPDEPLVDRLGKAIWLGWTLLLVGSPTFIFGPVIAGPNVAGWFIAAFGMGLLFPLVLLSLQTGHSFFSVVHAEAYSRLTRRPDYLLGYYATVAIAYAIIGVGIKMVFRWPGVLSAGGAFVIAVGLLLAARLYGRLAHLISFIKTKSARPVRQRQPVHRPRPTNIPRPQSAARTTTPNDDAYGLRSPSSPEPDTGPAHQSLKRVWIEEGADEPYAFAAGETKPQKQVLPEAFTQPSEYEIRLAAGERPVPPPDHPWLTGTFTFPFRPSNWKHLAWLTLGLTMSGIFLNVIVGSSR